MVTAAIPAVNGGQRQIQFALKFTFCDLRAFTPTFFPAANPQGCRRLSPTTQLDS